MVEVIQILGFGLRFDAYSVFVMALAPALFYLASGWAHFLSKQKRDSIFCWLFILFQWPALLMNFGDVEFVNFTGRRFTKDALFNLNEIGTGNLTGIFTQYWLPSAVCFLILGLFAFVILKVRTNLVFNRSSFYDRPSAQKLLLGLFSFVFMIVVARGGLQAKPLSFAHAQIFDSPYKNMAVLNSPFTFLQSLVLPSVQKYEFMSDDEMLTTILKDRESELLVPVDQIRFSEKQNVVVIILESFSSEHMGSVSDKETWTPFLDELSTKGLFFKNNFASGRRSIEGISSILAGVPVMMAEAWLNSEFVNIRIDGLGSLLKKQGYSTHFFHGGNNGTMFFDQFATKAGFENYYGANEYPNKADHDGSWGIYDEPFLKWMVQKLSEAPKPFAASVFTLSSHHPFKIPAQYKGKFPQGPSEIHEAIGYSDYALRQFFTEAEKQVWFKDTLFVITADHTFKIFRPEFNNELGHYRVPLLFYHPRWNIQNLQKMISRDIKTQHIDIVPSIMDFLNVPLSEENLLTKSVFRAGPRWNILGTDNRLTLVGDKFTTHFPYTGSPEVYEPQDLEFKKPISDEKLKSIELKQLQARLQYFSKAMFENLLYRPVNSIKSK